MEQRYPHFSLRTVFSFLFVFWLHKSTHAQQICTSPESVEFQENNTVNAIVTTISITSPDVTLSFIAPIDASFGLSGNDLIATQVLDYETAPTHTIGIQCTQGDVDLNLSLVVVVSDINDNPPVFSKTRYELDVPELLPIDTHIDVITATDADKGDRLYYTLDPDTEGFKLQGEIIPTILVQKVLDYDTVKSVTLTLTARDTASPVTVPSHTATTTIVITILDIDNRPPWFQPCTPTALGTAKICLSPRYSGQVNLTGQELGVLPLDPGPVYAIDGDVGLNEKIQYTFVGGNEAGIFVINADTGNITMAKPVDVAGPLILTVLASQSKNSDQFTTTTVTFEVVKMSLNEPRFEKAEYEGFISEEAVQGSMVLEAKDSTVPLRVLATDADFADGVNPDVEYDLPGATDFIVTPQGFILLAKDLNPGTVTIQLKAVDSSNGESSTASLVVEVTGTPTTPTMGPTTATDMASTTIDVASTTIDVASTTIDVASTTIDVASTTVEMASTTVDVSSTSVDMTSDTTHLTEPSTSQPTVTTPDNLSTSSPTTTTGPHTGGVLVPGGGGYGPGDMAAVGASLAVLLLICMVAIGLLVFSVRKGKADWRKLSEASVFCSTLAGGSGGLKEGVQYTNEGFQNDGDTGSSGSDGPEEDGGGRGGGPGGRAGDRPLEGGEAAAARASAPLHSLLPDDSSSADGSDKVDGEKEVKPILTKERRVEEGYKSVWFKEDIDPDAKEEVVIIPDNGGGRDSSDDEDDEVSMGGGEEEDDDSPLPTTKKVFFSNGDVDSGLGGPSNQDSDEDEYVTSDL